MMLIKCPACDSILKKDWLYACQYGIEEYQYSCPNKCYFETFAYGSTEINVCGFVTGYHHTTPKEDISKIFKQIKAICDIEKQNLVEEESA